MAEFKGMIGLEQLAPEVLEFLQKYVKDEIAKAIAQPGKDEGNNGNIIKGYGVISIERPVDEPDFWLEVTDGSIMNTLESDKVIVSTTGNIPTNLKPGQVVIEIEREDNDIDLKGIMVVSPEIPTVPSNFWSQVTDGSITTQLVSTDIAVAKSPDDFPKDSKPGQFVVELKN